MSNIEPYIEPNIEPNAVLGPILELDELDKLDTLDKLDFVRGERDQNQKKHN